MANPKNIAVIPGDGIGPEIVPEALKALDAAVGEQAFNYTHYDLGAERWLRTGEVLQLRDFTSNADGKVSEAIKGWRGNLKGSFQPRRATVNKKLTVCDRASNVASAVDTQEPCNRGGNWKKKTEGPVSWRVSDDGLTLGFQGPYSVRHVEIPWKEIPQLR
jgi:hypothetical protein